jgi:hypothetical protein
MSALTFAAPDKPEDGLPETLQRDQWGRPLIVPTDGGKATAYTRISTLCKALDDGFGLQGWTGRMTALGVARRPDLIGQASVLTDSDEDKPELNKLVDEAMAAAGAYHSRNMGTALHKLTQLADTTDADLRGIPLEMLADLDAYMQATSDLEIIDAEQFVVVDSVKAAGSYDRRVRDLRDGKVKIADIKTGEKAKDYPLSIAVQCGLYAHGLHYDPATGERIDFEVDLEQALLIHLPAGSGTCTLYDLDIRGAMAAAQVANTIRDWRKSKLATPRP